MGVSHRPASGAGERLSRWWDGCALVFILQLGVLLSVSTYQWSRRGEGVDVAFYSQAWWEIAHGNLNPHSTVFGIPVLHNNLELILWPLALLEPVIRTPLGLLYLQDLAIAATGLVGLRWVNALLWEKHLPNRTRAGLLALAAFATAACPWAYFAAMYDFHLETLTGLFVVLTARELWRDRMRAAGLYSVLLASTGLAGLLCLLGIAVSVIRQKPRGRVFALVAAGTSAAMVVWGVSETMVGEGGQTLGSFRYLNPSLLRPTPVQRLSGLVVHFPEVLHFVGARLPLAALFLMPVGIVGVVWHRVAPVVLAVFLPPMMASIDLFFRPFATFQIWPAMTLVLVGSIEMIARAASQKSNAGRARNLIGRWLSFYYPGAWVSGSIVTAVAVSTVAMQFLPESPAAGAVLQQIQSHLSPSAEVISPTGTLGDFAMRSLAYQLSNSGPIPVRASQVDFVFAPINRRDPQELTSVLGDLERSSTRLPGARVMTSADGVTEVVWFPPAGTAFVKLAGRVPTYGATWESPAP